QTVLNAVVVSAQEQVATLPLLTADEQDLILSSWNNTRTAYPNRSSLHRLFEAQVELAPDSIALVFQDEQLSFACLNQRANQLACYLLMQGIAPHTLIGVALGRSLDLVIAILAILKVGGAYVPLDPSYPMERLAYMLKDTNAPVLLTHQHLQARLPYHQARIICLDTIWS